MNSCSYGNRRNISRKNHISKFSQNKRLNNSRSENHIRSCPRGGGGGLGCGSKRKVNNCSYSNRRNISKKDHCKLNKTVRRHS